MTQTGLVKTQNSYNMKGTLVSRKIEVLNTDHLSVKENVSINRVINYAMPFLEEKLKMTEAIPINELEASIREFKKFCILAIIAKRDNLRLGMTSSLVDEVWHQFILFTRKYQWFCSEQLGFFLHHTPTTSYTPVDPRETNVFFELYLRHFGTIHPTWMKNLSSSFRKNLAMGFTDKDCSGDGSCTSCASTCSSNCGNCNSCGSDGND